MRVACYLVLCLLCVAQPSYALIHSDAKAGSAEFLVSACQEYIEIYDKKDDPHFGAFLTTSKEESFRAGYCLGALMNVDNICTSYVSRSVYRAAEVVASVGLDDTYSEARLLERAICR
ncbi:hypothetical protein BZG76_09675 [Salinivibrio sp. AR647]|uniref:hypothetical protein n=1 Tax=Salinivibrio sp. AR647 TaxID=1909438 RepID=UPI0009852CF8|nr:hypothetical protein [Salinivibrio sp. AR647]OOE92094.1 hypothetical protein BZG76_09675 [Salinivibrio sp. AR647]